jgi:hypothetical protein
LATSWVFPVGCVITTGGVCLNDEEKGPIGLSGMVRAATPPDDDRPPTGVLPSAGGGRVLRRVRLPLRVARNLRKTVTFTLQSAAPPACGFWGIPPFAIVYAVPEFI